MCSPLGVDSEPPVEAGTLRLSRCKPHAMGPQLKAGARLPSLFPLKLPCMRQGWSGVDVEDGVQDMLPPNTALWHTEYPKLKEFGQMQSHKGHSPFSD